MPKKSALPLGTTPHRRKKAPTKKSTVETDDYCFGDDATAVPSSTSKTMPDKSKVCSRPKSTSSNPETNRDGEKENTNNRKPHDESMKELNKSMSLIRINPKQKNKIRPIQLPTCNFPIISTHTTKPLNCTTLPPTLVKAIHSTSIGQSYSLAIEENLSLIKNNIKSCLKTQGIKVDNLRMAIHSLRSIMDMDKKENSVKFAFHCVVLGGEGMMGALDVATDKSHDKSEKWKEVAEYAILTLAAYQTLGQILHGKFSWNENLLPSNNILPKHQLKIALESGIAASSAWLHLSLLSNTAEDEFGLDLSSGSFSSMLHNVTAMLHGQDVKYAKRTFRFLWDGARCAQDSTVGELQCLAVAVLGEYCVEAYASSSKEDNKELFSLWEKASSCALKVAVEKRQSEDDGVLEFHNVAGGMLDNVWVQFGGGDGPSAYFEYCIYRAMYRWKFGVYESIHVPEEMLQDKSRGDGESTAMASYAVVLLAIDARLSLSNSEAKDSLADCDAVVSNFEGVIRHASPNSQTRCRSMIMMLNLQREATKLIASQSDTRCEQGRALSVLGYVLGRCMAPLETRLSNAANDKQKSLNLRLSASDNHGKAASFLDAATEDSNVSNKTREKWNVECVRQVRKGFELLSPIVDEMEELKGGSPVVLAGEVFAKAAASLGRKLLDRKETTSSIQCQMYATELLTRLATKISSHTFFEKYQIASRYMLLASAFEMNGNREELCASLAMAVWSAAKKNALQISDGADDDTSFVGDSVSEEILLFPAAALPDVQSHSESVSVVDGLSVMVNKLARAIIEVLRSDTPVRSNANPRVASMDTILSRLLQTATHNTKNAICVPQLLDFIVCGHGEFTINQTLELIREILKCTAKVLKCYVSSDISDGDLVKLSLALTQGLNEFLCLQVERIKSMVPPEDLQVISSALNVSFAMCLIDSQYLRFPKPNPFRPFKDDAKSGLQNVMLRVSLDQLQQSERIFASSSSDDCAHDVCYYVQWAAVLLHQAIVFEQQQEICGGCDSITNTPMREYNRVLEICNHAIRRLVNAHEEAPFPVIESLVATLRRLLCRFSLHADPVSSSQCYVLLQQIYSLDEKSRHIFDSVSDFLWISSKFDDLAAVLFRKCVFDSSRQALGLLSEEVQQLNEDEQITLVSNCIVDLMAAISQQLPGVQVEDAVQNVNLDHSLSIIANHTDTHSANLENADVQDEMEMNALGAKTDAIVQIQSFLVTSLMLQSKLALSAKRPASALKCLEACRIECKRMVSLLRLASSHLKNHEDKLIQVEDLISMGLERMSIAFSTLGLRRKAEDTAVLAVVKQKVFSLDSPNLSKITFEDLIENIDCIDDAEMFNFLPPIRTLITIKSLSLPPDKLAIEPSYFEKLNFSISSDCPSINRIVNRSRTLLTYDDSFRSTPDLKSQCDGLLPIAYKSILNLTKQPESETLTHVPLATFVSPLDQELKLRLIQKETDRSSASDALERILDNPDAIPSCLADAYFELGLEALRKAKESNELNILWKDHIVYSHENEEREEFFRPSESTLFHTLTARKYFKCALLHANPASSYTTKKILRCYALVTGPVELSAFLIHTSVGGTSRNLVKDAISSNQTSNDRLHRIFNLFDDETLTIEERAEEFNILLSDYQSIIPANWSISAIAICPTGEVLITSFGSSSDGVYTNRTVCIMPHQADDAMNNFYESILFPLDKIIERSQKQLHGIDEEIQSQKYNDELSKRKWWEERHSIDDDLRSLLQHAEVRFFGHVLVRRLLVSTTKVCSEFDDDSSECSDIGPGNLASKFDAAEQECTPDFDVDKERLALKKLTVADLKDKLNSLGVGRTQIQKMRKADLIELVITEMEDLQKNQSPLDHHIEVDAPAADILHHPDEVCSILILDEHLHRLPLESMDMFASTAVTRMPSLPFVIAALCERQSAGENKIPQIDPNKVNFILDPEQNLSETASKMSPALNLMASENGWEWNGCVGKTPSPEFMTEALTQENGLLLYCGHGGGEKFFTRSQVEDFINYYPNDTSEKIRGCSSVVVLMGCSSGKLKSVNSPKDPGRSFYPIHYEPEGIALSYIFAGAPCVVGNLWDVTDRDIDRYCLTLLENFFSQSNEDLLSPSLAKCVATARHACKLRYIVGGAPVCYGIPVQCRKATL